jgi:SAM-dependent methyltransferase
MDRFIEDSFPVKEIPSQEDSSVYLNKILDIIGQKHIDIGCGDGSITRHFADNKPNSEIIGLDKDPNLINNARITKKSQHENLLFTTDPNDNDCDSGDSIRGFHEMGEELFIIAAKYLKPGAEFVIVDYDFIKENQTGRPIRNINDIHYSLYEFKSIFNSKEELNEVNKIGWENAYSLHTRYNRHICRKMAEKSGFFETEKCEKLSDKLFIWKGRKK